ncbi:MAG: dipeptidase PepE [Flavobacteriales bacterium]|nr:dipeptidase PepE [Flavobacteriales bacterium]MCB9179746.1 dipeptidase PepE [Flavobacteriales bacterium]MCB9194488.1 dipeptidase PepE [Flavobacteriales bacterium]
MHLLLLSNSTLPGEPFLGWPREHLSKFLDGRRTIAFVPFAAVTFSFDAYMGMVAPVFEEMGVRTIGLHRENDPKAALATADAVAVGGGNTFRLIRELYRNDLVRTIRKRVQQGMGYVGWSAGSNVACPTIMTTNDMPITEPPSFRAMHLVPFQINPHYTDARPEGHGGETRDQRITEFLEMNPEVPVLGLREGSGLRMEEGGIELLGRDMRLFRKGHEHLEVTGGTRFHADLREFTANTPKS